MNVRGRVATALYTGIALLASAEVVYAGQVAVPEPATLTLLGVGAAAMGAVAWWRRRK